MISSVCIVGLGGVGGYFASKFITPKSIFGDQFQLYGLARGEHLSAIRNTGLQVKYGENSVTCRFDAVSNSLHDLPVADLYVLAVKSYDLDAVLVQMQPMMKPETVILPLLNGVDIYERIRHIISIGIVLPACVYVGTHISAPGMISQNGGDGKILFGNDPYNNDPEILSSIFSFLDNASVVYVYEPDPSVSIWSKFCFIACLGIVCSAFRLTIGEALAYKRETLYQLASEIVQLAGIKGVVFRSGFAHEVVAKGYDFPSEAKPSVLRDIEQKGSCNELDLFAGSLLRNSYQCRIRMPMLEKLVSVLAKEGVYMPN